MSPPCTSVRGGARFRPHPSALRPPPSALALLVAFLLAAGCGPSKPETVPVSGTVTWNGQALSQGSILFAPEDGKGVPDPGDIKDGRYQLQAKTGKKKVEIRATRESGKVDPAMGAAPREQYIPAEYNEKTTLRADVKSGEKNEFNFPLAGPDGKKP